jgi:hypothetical protein
MLRGIRARLLGLVIVTVVPFMALTGVGLWMQWRNDRDQAYKNAQVEARLLAAAVDDQLGNIENLLAGLSRGSRPLPICTVPILAFSLRRKARPTSCRTSCRHSDSRRPITR